MNLLSGLEPGKVDQQQLTARGNNFPHNVEDRITRKGLQREAVQTNNCASWRAKIHLHHGGNSLLEFSCAVNFLSCPCGRVCMLVQRRLRVYSPLVSGKVCVIDVLRGVATSLRRGFHLSELQHRSHMTQQTHLIQATPTTAADCLQRDQHRLPQEFCVMKLYQFTLCLVNLCYAVAQWSHHSLI